MFGLDKRIFFAMKHTHCIYVIYSYLITHMYNQISLHIPILSTLVFTFLLFCIICRKNHLGWAHGWVSVLPENWFWTGRLGHLHLDRPQLPHGHNQAEGQVTRSSKKIILAQSSSCSMITIALVISTSTNPHFLMITTRQKVK